MNAKDNGGFTFLMLMDASDVPALIAAVRRIEANRELDKDYDDVSV